MGLVRIHHFFHDTHIAGQPSPPIAGTTRYWDTFHPDRPLHILGCFFNRLLINSTTFSMIFKFFKNFLHCGNWQFLQGYDKAQGHAVCVQKYYPPPLCRGWDRQIIRFSAERLPSSSSGNGTWQRLIFGVLSTVKRYFAAGRLFIRWNFEKYCSPQGKAPSKLYGQQFFLRRRLAGYRKYGSLF